jgi:trehalose-6-phosphate synthase
MSETFVSPAAALWTRKNFHNLIAAQMRNVRFIVVSNREPYIHRHSENGIVCMQPASGMASALDPVMKASGGVWVAYGSGDADR